MEIKDTAAYMVTRFAPEGESSFHPVLGEDIKNMLRNCTYDPEIDTYINSDKTIRYKIMIIG